MSADWHSLTGREQDQAIASLLGWKKNTHGVWASPVGQHILGGLPSFTISLDAMRMVEGEIERRDLQVEYSATLKDIVAAAYPLQPDQHFMFGAWRLIHASAAHRAEAAYRALSERDAVRTSLIAAGLSLPPSELPGQLTPEQRDELARRIKGKPLSEIIIEERGE